MLRANSVKLAWILLLLSVACLPAQAQTFRDQVVAAERSGLDALKAGDTAAFATTIADDAIFVDAAGAASKAEVVKHVADFHLVDYTMSDIQVLQLSRDSGLIVYRSVETGTSHGKSFTAAVLVSSIWTKQHGKWRCQFSQETASKAHG